MPKRTSTPSTAATQSAGERLVSAGVVAAAVGVALAMAPGGYSTFGPIKATVLLASVTCIAIGFALERSLALGALRRAGAQRATWPAAALVGVALLSTLTSIDPSQSVTGHFPEYQGLLLLLAAAIAGFGAYALTERDAAWQSLKRAVTVALLFVTAYAVAQFANLDVGASAHVTLIRRVRSTLGNASNLGVFLCVAVPLALALARTPGESKAWRRLAWVATGAGAVTLAVTLSRGAWLGAIAGVFAWLSVESRGWTRRKRAIGVAVASGCAVAALGLTLLLVPHAAGRFGALLDPTTGTAGWRAEVWGATVTLAAQRPILGFGPATFRYAFPPQRTASMMAGETGVQALDDPHNLFASALVTGGIAALLCLVWLVAEAIRSAWRLSTDPKDSLTGAALLASMVGGLVALQFHFVTLDTAPLLAIVIAVAVGREGRSVATGRGSDDVTAGGRAAAVRGACAAVAVALAVCTVLASGTVLADRRIARGYALLATGESWAVASEPFAAAVRLAPWEPALVWAMGRGATQSLSQHDEPATFADAARVMAAASAALPLDPLVAAHTADVYVLSGVRNHDSSKLESALPLLARAIALDPENGYRWASQASALAGLGRIDEAIASAEKAVRYSPNDVQAWRLLAALYDQSGRPEQAAQARARSGAATP